MRLDEINNLNIQNTNTKNKRRKQKHTILKHASNNNWTHTRNNAVSTQHKTKTPHKNTPHNTTIKNTQQCNWPPQKIHSKATHYKTANKTKYKMNMRKSIKIEYHNKINPIENHLNKKRCYKERCQRFRTAFSNYFFAQHSYCSHSQWCSNSQKIFHYILFIYPDEDTPQS